MYISAINKFLSRFDTALAPDVLKFAQIWMLVIATPIFDGSYSIDKTDLASPPLLVTWLPLVISIEDAAGYDRDAGHARRLR
jgi:hypothetical protein